MSAMPLALPAGLRAALDARGGEVVWQRDEGPRTYVRAVSAEGELFGWCTRDPREAPMVDREVLIRETVGETGPLRAPRLLERGDGWRLERWIASEPIEGSRAVAAAVAAAARLAELDLPTSVAPSTERRRHALARRVRVIGSPVPVGDYLQARRLYEGSALPRTTSHGDFHPVHLLFDEGVIWLIDWDLAGVRPAGFDLMQLWTSLGAADRDELFEHAVELVGARHRLELARLRYAVLVQMAAAHFTERHAVNRNPEEGARLLALLPQAREEAGV